LRFGKNGTLVSLSATGKAQKGRKFFVVLLMKFERDGLAGESLDEDLHAFTQKQN